jgi:hypothetical protein
MYLAGLLFNRSYILYDEHARKQPLNLRRRRRTYKNAALPVHLARGRTVWIARLR